jgi:flagellar motility protein MotE (MotC chaperone)
LAALKPMDLTPSAEAARELDLAKKELRAQIAALKKDRDQMLNNLAAQLSTLPLEEAAAQLRELDDESAGLVLVRLKPEKRRALLGQLEPARANRLAQALTPPSR